MINFELLRLVKVHRRHLHTEVVFVRELAKSTCLGFVSLSCLLKSERPNVEAFVHRVGSSRLGQTCMLAPIEVLMDQDWLLTLRPLLFFFTRHQVLYLFCELPVLGLGYDRSSLLCLVLEGLEVAFDIRVDA